MSATATPEQIRRFSLQSNDVLITKDSETWMDIAVPAVVAKDLPGVLCGYHLAQIRPSSECDGRFLSRFISAIGPRDQFQISANGITRFGITSDAIRNGTFATPPPDEQRAIASFLDRETAKIDALVAKKKRLIELLQEKRVALITHAVTKGLDPDIPMKDSGVDWLGAIPAHWEILALRRRWQIIDCKHVTVPFVDQGIPLASVRETQSFELNLSNAKCTTRDWYEMLVEGKRSPQRGDLVYCRNVSVGSAALVNTDERFAMGQDVCTIRSAWENQRWLNYYLCSNAMSNQLATILVGSTFDRINVSEIRELITPVPPRQQQDEIAAFLDCEAAKIDALVAKVREAIDRLKELRTALISAAVTGKIDVRDTAA